MESVWSCRDEIVSRVVSRFAKNKQQLNTSACECAGTVLDKSPAHPLALRRRDNGQWGKDGGRDVRRTTDKSYLGEQSVPDWPICLVSKERNAWLSSLISKQGSHQVRLIVAREGQAFDAQYDIDLGRARFNYSHGAEFFS